MKASVITLGHRQTVLRLREALLHSMLLLVALRALLIQAVTKYDLIPLDLTFVKV